MRKHVLTALSCAALLMVTCTACAQQKADTSAADSSTGQEATHIAPPENGWTPETLLNASSLCGVPFAYPLTLNVLGENFKLDTKDYTLSKEGYVIASLEYKDGHSCGVSLESKSVEEIDGDTPIIFLMFAADDFPEGAVRINSITQGSSCDEVRTALGEPAEGSDENGTWIYYFQDAPKDDFVRVLFNDGKVSALVLNWKPMQ
ncbi:MAG: hypothetical protein J5851_09250 [Oscillospiraceae bacterium]|nr:hypothetical protein [Oscillospiraceae bacterium]